MAAIFIYLWYNYKVNFQIITIIILAFGFAMILYLQSRKPKQDEGMKVMLEWLKEMRGSSETMQKRLDDRLGETNKVISSSIAETNKAVNERLDTAAKVISALQKELGGMTQIGPDIRKLSEVLSGSKTRGNFAEEMLEELIRQVLPTSAYHFQYRFKSGEIVDAALKVGDHLLPIDSKFSLENYRLYIEAKTDDAADGLKKALLKDVKKRIDEIHKKYILTQEKTFDFALMYVQSEGVLNEILKDGITMAYAREKKVYPVGPNNLYHNLQMLLVSLKGQQINEAAAHILQMITGIKQESDKFGRNLDVLGSHIKNAGNTMGVVNNDFGKLRTTIQNAASLKLETKQPVLEIPKVDQVDDFEVVN